MPDGIEGLAELLPDTIIEYRNPPPSVCGHERGIDLRLSQPAGSDVIMIVRVECGQVLRQGDFPYLETCVRVRAHNDSGGAASALVSIDDVGGACMPLPEPDVATGLLAGVLVLVAFCFNVKRPAPPKRTGRRGARD